MVRSALVQPGSGDHLRVSEAVMPNHDIAVFNELAKAVTMAAEPWLREALRREVLADTSALRFTKATREDDKPQPVQLWRTELVGDIDEVLLLQVPEAHARYLAGGQVSDEAKTALTSVMAGWTRVCLATVARLVDWQIDTHTVYLEEASKLPKVELPWGEQEVIAILTCGWTFVDGGVIFLEYWMPVDLVRRIAQRLCRVEKREPGAPRSLREGVVRTYRPEKAGRTGYAPVLPVEFPQIQETAAVSDGNKMELVKDVVLSIQAELAKTELEIGELLQLKIGDVVKLGKMAGEPMELSLNGHYIARGEVLVLDDRLGIRISEIISAADRLERVQG
ncbi:MAG: hypothetical protein GX354_01620 [Firmicutes bacterium]|jgi:flagellar motor switch protein FliN/FliY|nr:hypothetical protein [Bacillota bacterium]